MMWSRIFFCLCRSIRSSLIYYVDQNLFFEELPVVNSQSLQFFYLFIFLAVASSLSFQMAWPYYDGMRNTTPNPHCSALSVFPRQQSPTIWKALIPQFLSLSSNGFLHCPSFIRFFFFFQHCLSFYSLRHFLCFFCALVQFSLLFFPFLIFFTLGTYYITILFHLLFSILFISSCGHFILFPAGFVIF